MISGAFAIIASLAGRIGFGWLFSFFKGNILSSFLAPIAKTLTAVADLLMIVGRWAVQKIIAGLDHIVKSVPAVATVMLIAWGAYGYGKLTAANPAPAGVERRATPRGKARPRRRARRSPRTAPAKTSDNWKRNILNN